MREVIEYSNGFAYRRKVVQVAYSAEGIRFLCVACATGLTVPREGGITTCPHCQRAHDVTAEPFQDRHILTIRGPLELVEAGQRRVSAGCIWRADAKYAP